MLALGASALGFVSVTRTTAWAIRKGDPQRAHGLAPTDGRITALYAQVTLGQNRLASDRARTANLARQALRQDATAVVAVSTLGLVDQLNGRAIDARRLFAYSQELSRRDLGTQLWAIEDAVGRADVAAALRHYDIALRTRSEAPALLFPILAGAVAEPAVRSALIPMMARQPPWGQPFIEYLASSAPDPTVMTVLFAGLTRAGVPISRHARAAAVDALARRGLYDRAWTYYASINPGADRRTSRNPRFTIDPADPSPFDWNPVDQSGIVTSIQAGPRGGIVDVSAPGSVGGTALRQLQMLPPGDYLLEGHATPLNQARESLPYFALTCLDGRELGRVAWPDVTRVSGTFAGPITVPTGCAAQYLSLFVQPSDGALGFNGQLDRVRLRPSNVRN